MKIAQRVAHIMLAASVLTSVVACAPTPTREGTGEYIDDTLITGKVKAAFAADPNVKATEINVETFKGEVQLSGFVAQPADAARAAEIARGIKGVTSVKNDVRVK
ncbi:BON domain-containing protein [Massilia cavernae]|uniref:Osmotically-inducible protein Y n=1 Tax=Massilia cavernae TaxID=2320864 RepID=A0A418Y4B5_9BURK|nr:BON domain-containing protein [Massilia cavernae]RJG20478.1 BON domain-containing protein [Massilia cavernae]